jgi:hypothetical protein
MPRVIELESVDTASPQRLGKVDIHRPSRRALEPQRPTLAVRLVQQYFFYLKCRHEIELNPGAVFEHLELDGILAAEELRIGVDPYIQVVIEYVVVGPIKAIAAP